MIISVDARLDPRDLLGNGKGDTKDFIMELNRVANDRHFTIDLIGRLAESLTLCTDIKELNELVNELKYVWGINP